MNMQRITRLLECAADKAVTDTGKSRTRNIQVHTQGYAEPGYSCNNDEGIILTADWNTVTGWNEETHDFDKLDDIMDRLYKIFDERYKLGLEWEDEWTECHECGGLMRISPDSYGWTKNFCRLGCREICQDCIMDHYLGEYFTSMENNPKDAITLDVNPAEYKYELFSPEAFECGMHPGQDANPTIIAEGLRKYGLTRFIFSLDSKGQFGISFNVWIHKDEFQDVDALEAAHNWFKTGNWDGPSNAALLSQGLKAASVIADTLPTEGIKLLTVNGDGTASGRTVSPQEFAAGIK